MGLPVIATDIRGCREVVKSNETGILVPVKDSKALAIAIEALAQDKPRRDDLGKRGRDHILHNFNHDLVLKRLGDFYGALHLSRPPTTGIVHKEHLGVKRVG